MVCAHLFSSFIYLISMEVMGQSLVFLALFSQKFSQIIAGTCVTSKTFSLTCLAIDDGCWLGIYLEFSAGMSTLKLYIWLVLILNQWLDSNSKHKEIKETRETKRQRERVIQRHRDRQTLYYLLWPNFGNSITPFPSVLLVVTVTKFHPAPREEDKTLPSIRKRWGHIMRWTSGLLLRPF